MENLLDNLKLKIDKLINQYYEVELKILSFKPPKILKLTPTERFFVKELIEELNIYKSESNKVIRVLINDNRISNLTSTKELINFLGQLKIKMVSSIDFLNIIIKSNEKFDRLAGED